MPLARFDAPFEHPYWIFEPKLDGFRAVAYVEGGACRLVSRNRNVFKTFEPLAQAIGQELSGRSAILELPACTWRSWLCLVLSVALPGLTRWIVVARLRRRWERGCCPACSSGW
jgi:hypothetical protein